MATVITAISLQDTLFKQAEELAHKMHISRNHLFALALEDFIQRRSNQELLERINAAYADGPSPGEQLLEEQRRQAHHQMVGGEWNHDNS